MVAKGKTAVKSTHAIGRRKSSTARAFLTPGSGEILVNKRPFKEYFGRETSQMILCQPLEVAGKRESYNIFINVDGGGSSGQAGAARLAIARALVIEEPELRKSLRAAGLMTRDPRAVERKKYGLRGARRRSQYSKR